LSNLHTGVTYPNFLVHERFVHLVASRERIFLAG